MTTPKEVPVETDLAIRRLIARYCHLVDDRDFEPIGGLFSEDARLNIMGNDLHGRDNITEWLAATVSEGLSHQMNNVVVSQGSHGTFHALSDCLVVGRGEGGWGVLLIGRYHDTFVGEGRDVLFSQRLFTTR